KIHRATFQDRSNGDTYRIRFVFHADWLGLSPRSGRYRLYVEKRPQCQMELGQAAHLLAGEEICVAAGREPRTLERAKAIAMVWLHGFGIYRRTGRFPNDGARVNVVEN